ncbi:MAG: hypothetical protein AAFW81_08710 [Pseudomonadota bacterium]
MLNLRKKKSAYPEDLDEQALRKALDAKLAAIVDKKPGGRPVVERRASLRRQSEYIALVQSLDGDEKNDLACMVIDKTIHGARLRLDDEASLPERFYLYVPAFDMRRIVRKRWAKANEVGVDFDADEAGKDASIAPAE